MVLYVINTYCFFCSLKILLVLCPHNNIPKVISGNIKLEYIVRNVYAGTYCLKRFNIPRLFEILHATVFICVFHCKFFCRPMNLKVSVSYSGMLSIPTESELRLRVVFWKTINCDFITLSDSLVTFSHAVIFLILKLIFWFNWWIFLIHLK